MQGEHALTMTQQVVLSFALASIMTTTASICAMLLDQAFNSKGQLSFRAPMKSIRERFLDTEWKKDYAWRPFLVRTVRTQSPRFLP